MKGVATEVLVTTGDEEGARVEVGAASEEGGAIEAMSEIEIGVVDMTTKRGDITTTIVTEKRAEIRIAPEARAAVQIEAGAAQKKAETLQVVVVVRVGRAKNVDVMVVVNRKGMAEALTTKRRGSPHVDVSAAAIPPAKRKTTPAKPQHIPIRMIVELKMARKKTLLKSLAHLSESAATEPDRLVAK